MASYTVSTGDSLAAIAKRNKTTVAELLRLNPKLTSDPKYKDGRVIFNGTKITLPSTGGTSTPPPLAPTTTPPPSAPSTTIPTFTAPTFAPSALAAGESGAIGAASIASQMAAAQTPSGLPQPGSLVSATAEEPIPTLNAPAVFQPTEMPTLPPVAEQTTQSQTMPGVFIGTAGIADPNQQEVGTEFLVDPFTGRYVYDRNGNPVKVKMGGGANAYYDYLAGLARSRRNVQAAGAANKLAIERATATGDDATRTAERELYRSQQRALNELSRRGLSGAPGLTRAAQRAYGAQPLSQRLEAIRKMQSEITGANLLLAQQQSAEQAAEEQRQLDLTKATGIVNQLGGQ